jgi:hypothetical protein
MTYSILEKFRASLEISDHQDMLTILEAKYSHNLNAINYTVNQIQRLMIIINS